MKLNELVVEDKKVKKSKKDNRDKSAVKYKQHIVGNMLFNQTCSGSLSGEKTTES